MRNTKNNRRSNRLRMYRRIMGYQQEEVRRIFGLQSTSQISRWEKGLAMPSAENVFKLSILYKTLPNELFPVLVKDLRIEIADKWEFKSKRNKCSSP